MCFHTSQTKKVVALENRFNVDLVDDVLREIYDTPQFHNNGFEHSKSLIIPQEEPSKLVPSTWGIVPATLKVSEINEYYKKQLKYGSGLNARSEKLFDYWLYKNSALTRRCIIPVTGFFEPHEYQQKKYPIHIKHKNDDILGLAGIYNIIENVVTYTILTKNASPFFSKIHNSKLRQPILLKQELEQNWLQENLQQKEIEQLLAENYNDAELNAYAVSKDLFNTRIDSNTPEILEKEVKVSFEFK